jgi:hypothetical protein
VYESSPYVNAPFNVIYKNDGLGNGSADSGFFLYFVQGSLQSQDFSFSDSLPNRVFSINVNNINNTDLWLYQVDSNGNLSTQWAAVPSVANTNVVYNNSLNRNIYQINTRAGDQIDLVFGDGAFANIPQGRFRLYYRVSNGLQYKITPDEMQNIVININYVSTNSRVETLTVSGSLQYTVANASARETLEDIKLKAPQQFYTQNRMISGEDYNILPYTLFNSVLKVKAVNRTSSGISRYLDVIDATGKYSSTNIFAQDGMLYKSAINDSFNFEYLTLNNIYQLIYNRISKIVQSVETRQLYYDVYPAVDLINMYWHTSTTIANGSTGYFVNSAGAILQVGSSVSGTAGYIQPGAVVRLWAGSGKYFDSQNYVRTGSPSHSGDKLYLYATVEKIVGDGTNSGQGNLYNGRGPVTINQVIPADQTIVSQRVFAVFNTDLPNDLVNGMVSYMQAYVNFGLRYDSQAAVWQLITAENLNLQNTKTLSLINSGDTSGLAQDGSWFVSFEAQGKVYKIRYRGLIYVFESVAETNFYYDGSTKIFDDKTGLTVNDQIKVLRVNSQPDSNTTLGLDYVWYVSKPIVEVDGYTNINRIEITFSDVNNDGVPDNPEMFDFIVNDRINTVSKYVYHQYTVGYDNFTVLTPISNQLVVSKYTTLRELESNKTLYQDQQLFYLVPSDEFYQLQIKGAVYSLMAVQDYVANLGRQELYFQYRHNSPNNRRIDPSPNNLVDLYMLTRQYSQDYMAWIQDTSNTVSEPTAPTTEQLETAYGDLNKYKAISDTVIYNPAQIKPLFGAKADATLQATFKVVKNPNVVVSDNEIKSSVIAAINQYFDIANWDFGETFYFSELAAYLHMRLSPNISSVIIVPANSNSVFGSLLQVNSNINEILTSAATVDNVQIITAITAAQLNQTQQLTTQ